MSFVCVQTCPGSKSVTSLPKASNFHNMDDVKLPSKTEHRFLQVPGRHVVKVDATLVSVNVKDFGLFGGNAHIN